MTGWSQHSQFLLDGFLFLKAFASRQFRDAKEAKENEAQEDCQTDRFQFRIFTVSKSWLIFNLMFFETRETRDYILVVIFWQRCSMTDIKNCFKCVGKCNLNKNINEVRTFWCCLLRVTEYSFNIIHWNCSKYFKKLELI